MGVVASGIEYGAEEVVSGALTDRLRSSNVIIRWIYRYRGSCGVLAAIGVGTSDSVGPGIGYGQRLVVGAVVPQI